MGALSLQVLAGQTVSYQCKLLGLMVENSLSQRAPLKPLPAGPASCSMLKKCNGNASAGNRAYSTTMPLMPS